MTFTTIILGSARLTLSDEPSGFVRMNLVAGKLGVDLRDAEIAAIATALRTHGRAQRHSRAGDGVSHVIDVPRQHTDQEPDR